MRRLIPAALLLGWFTLVGQHWYYEEASGKWIGYPGWHLESGVWVRDGK
jgi:hypothetical protein